MKKNVSIVCLLMITLLASACAPVKDTSQPGQPPVPTLSPSETPAAASTATSQPVVVSTSVQSSVGGVIGTIPPTSTPGDNPNDQLIPQQGITRADNGKTFVIKTGDRFLLNLGMENYTWDINIDNQEVLRRVPNITVIKGAQGVYEALKTGQASLTASGDPLCRSAKPPCMIPSIIFRVTITVQ